MVLLDASAASRLASDRLDNYHVVATTLRVYTLLMSFKVNYLVIRCWRVGALGGSFVYPARMLGRPLGIHYLV